MAGLLDILSAGDNSGGLLDLLRRSAMQQQMPSGLASDQAQYDSAPIFPAQPQVQSFAGQGQPSPLDNAQWPYGPVGAPSSAPQIAGPNSPSPLDTAQWPAGPVGAPSNAMAQMPGAQPQTSAQPAQAQAASLPNVYPSGGSLMTAFQNWAHTPLGNPIAGIANGIQGLTTGQSTDPTAVAQQSANMTARALLAKGVDPAAVQAAITNPELMKTLITQAYGPQTVQSLGNGYVWDQKKGAAVKAYEPEDKIPVGFQKTDKGLEPIPGGPADPAYLRQKAQKEQDPNAIHVLGRGGELYKTDANGNPVIVHKNEAETALLDDNTTKAMAAQYLAGDKSVMTNLGRGGQGAANIIKLRTEIYKQAQDAGLNGRDIVDNFNEQAGALAGQRAVGTRAANISLAANEANNMIPIALAASDKLPRSQYMPWNQMVQAVQKGSSSPELASFVAATNSLVNSYVRAVSPSGVPTDSMREHAYSMLNAAQGPEAYKAVIETMKQEMKAALEAPSQVKKELRHKSEEPATQPAMTGKTKNGVSWGVVQ